DRCTPIPADASRSRRWKDRPSRRVRSGTERSRDARSVLAQRCPPRAELAEIGGAVGDIGDPFANPTLEALSVPGGGVVLVEEVVVAPVAVLDRRRMARPRLVHDGGDLRPGDDRAIRIARDHCAIDDLFREDDGRLRRERGLLRYAPRTPEMSIPVLVRALHRDH